ncbi:putative uncharacterized protein DDB_G0282133 isoform X2 [Scaptodrosophila lebanonensis]|uniref:Uncharacterized protein n=1 Tax=Drosophila lebanonensis TaxID=7225 RepID=A0A6J2U6W6_DROLE|nr:putative uncharacterized protein DDB_G0282133 isoform X2 [Scaptodrosophila lebanonensis]
MSKHSNFLDGNDRFKEQNLRFVRNDLQDNINQFFGRSGTSANIPPRDSMLVQPKPAIAADIAETPHFRSLKLDECRNFLRHLGVNRRTAHSLAVRTLKCPDFNLRQFQQSRFHRSVQMGDIQQAMVDSEIVRDIEVFCEQRLNEKEKRNSLSPVHIATLREDREQKPTTNTGFHSAYGIGTRRPYQRNKADIMHGKDYKLNFFNRDYRINYNLEDYRQDRTDRNCEMAILNNNRRGTRQRSNSSSTTSNYFQSRNNSWNSLNNGNQPNNILEDYRPDRRDQSSGNSNDDRIRTPKRSNSPYYFQTGNISPNSWSFLSHRNQFKNDLEDYDRNKTELNYGNLNSNRNRKRQRSSNDYQNPININNYDNFNANRGSILMRKENRSRSSINKTFQRNTDMNTFQVNNNEFKDHKLRRHNTLVYDPPPRSRNAIMYPNEPHRANNGGEQSHAHGSKTSGRIDSPQSQPTYIEEYFQIGGFKLPYIHRGTLPLSTSKDNSYAVRFFAQIPDYTTNRFSDKECSDDGDPAINSEDDSSIDSAEDDRKPIKNTKKGLPTLNNKKMRKEWIKVYREKNYKCWKSWWMDYKWCGDAINQELGQFKSVNLKLRFLQIPYNRNKGNSEVIDRVMKSGHFALEKNLSNFYRNMKAIFNMMNETFLENLTPQQTEQIQNMIRGVPNHIWLYKMRSMLFVWCKYREYSRLPNSGSKLRKINAKWKKPVFHWLAKQAFEEIKVSVLRASN